MSRGGFVDGIDHGEESNFQQECRLRDETTGEDDGVVGRLAEEQGGQNGTEDSLNRFYNFLTRPFGDCEGK